MNTHRCTSRRFFICLLAWKEIVVVERAAAHYKTMQAYVVLSASNFSTFDIK